MENYRILADNQYRDNNTWVSGLNNNDLIIGPSGAGKTRNYVKPNLMQCNESMVITDTKGTLHRQMGSLLKENGYKIILIDYKNLGNSYGYNPFDYIRYDTISKQYNEQDILTISTNIVTSTTPSDPFWELAARMYLTSLIAYCLETNSAKDHNLETVYNLFTYLISDQYRQMICTHEREHPKSFAVRQYKLFATNSKAEKMNSSILGILAEKINVLVLPELVNMYKAEKRLNFSEMTEKKTAVFITVSDTDRSMDQLVGLFYAQALNTLCNIADNKEEGRLTVPVRFYLDDFATNTVIDGFDNIISVIRSREIYVSIILQSISQLNALYGAAKAKTIINNCDNCLYLGGQDVETADFIAVKANKSINEVLNMPLGKAHLFTRGVGGLEVKKYDIKSHEKYCDLPEYRKENPTKEPLAEVAEIAELEEAEKLAGPFLQELQKYESNKSRKKTSFRERRILAQKEFMKTVEQNNVVTKQIGGI